MEQKEVFIHVFMSQGGLKAHLIPASAAARMVGFDGMRAMSFDRLQEYGKVLCRGDISSLDAYWIACDLLDVETGRTQ